MMFLWFKRVMIWSSRGRNLRINSAERGGGFAHGEVPEVLLAPGNPWDLAEGGKVVVGCLAPFPEGCFVEGDGAGLHQRFAALVVGGAAV